MKKFNKSQLLLTTLLSGAVIGSVAMPAFAQANNDEVVVTGTRVQRKDLEAPSPVTSVSAEALAVVNTVNSEEFINTLPQAIPGFDSTSNNPGNGTATVNLRGLGSNRTLVLVDGQRYVSANGDGVVDLNSIPSALVKRVDVVTGGASAVYGSDAMSGVVNFVLEDSFEGAELAGTYEITEKGDGAKKNISLTVGGNFDNGRGNATVFAGWSQRDDVFQGDRDYSAVANSDNGTSFDPFGSSGVPGTRIFDGFDFTNAGYTTDGTACTAPGGGSSEGLSGTCTGGATFDGSGNIIPWINGGANTTRYNYAPVNYLQLPQERYTLAAFGRYDITDTVELKVRSIFTSNVVPSELAPTPFFSSVTIDMENNPFLAAGTRAAFQSTANGNLADAQASLATAQADLAAEIAGGNDADVIAGLNSQISGFNSTIATMDPDSDNVAEFFPIYIGRRMLETGPRRNDQELQSMQISADLSGEFGFGWDWDIHGHLSRTSGSVIQTGNVSRSALQAAVLGNQCNIFGGNNFSAACAQQVVRTGALQAVSEQRNIVATTGGAIESFKSPMADDAMQVVLGVEYREDEFDFRPDSVLGPDVAGFNSSLPVSGVTDTYEAFGEVYWPLIQGGELADELSLNGAYRYTEHNLVGGFSSYALGAEWAPIPDIRFRGQYQKSVRAPNVVELFSPQTNGFPGAQDPCSRNVSSNAAALGDAAICAANGVPAALFNTQFQANGQIEGLFGGNPNLTQESSDTLTFGFVAQPSFVDGLTLTVDWYDIDIDDVISTIPVQTALDDCFNGNVPAYCNLINRSAAGLIDNIVLTNQNVAFLGAQGIDFQVDYGWDAADIGMGDFGGEFDFQIIGGYALKNEFQALPGDPIDDCVGFHGAQANICGEPLPELKTTTRLTYANGPYSLSTRWRYLSNTRNDEFNPNDVDENGVKNVRAAKLADETGAQHYFDLTGTWDVSDVVQLSGGILNLTDNQPPVMGDCCSEQANTYPATYRTLGRKFYVGAKLRF